MPKTSTEFTFHVTREHTEEVTVGALNEAQALDMLLKVIDGKATKGTASRVSWHSMDDPYGNVTAIRTIKESS